MSTVRPCNTSRHTSLICPVFSSTPHIVYMPQQSGCKLALFIRPSAFCQALLPTSHSLALYYVYTCSLLQDLTCCAAEGSDILSLVP